MEEKEAFLFDLQGFLVVRHALFLKYSPHPLSWAAGYFDAEAYPDLSERQRAILEAPNARYQGRKK